jgi:hypothetical protein
MSGIKLRRVGDPIFTAGLRLELGETTKLNLRLPTRKPASEAAQMRLASMPRVADRTSCPRSGHAHQLFFPHATFSIPNDLTALQRGEQVAGERDGKLRQVKPGDSGRNAVPASHSHRANRLILRT